jgi:ketosteroid isomerase-like protein
MKSKMLLVLTAGLLIGAQDAKQNPAVQEIQKAIGTLNDAFAKRDADAVRRLMIDEHLSITAYYGGPATKADQLKSLADLQLTEYKAGELKVTMLTDDAALVAYPLAQKGTYKQRPVAAKNYASAVWIKRNGKWLEASYQETPLSGD